MQIAIRAATKRDYDTLNEIIGRALMDRAQRWAEELGATEIELNVYEFNETAIDFYQSLGYATSSRKMSKRLD